ncbi:MAG TPA: ATP-dependent DNA ligase [Acidimicrobiales bacterium]|nr:ATP-dependent DNA ligase [Acidimicrobiales bacterium]
MPFADVVATSAAVGSTRARSTKVAALAALLARAGPTERAAVVAMLAGEVRQGRIGVGWATLASVTAAHAAAPELTVGDVDAALGRLDAVAGSGSVAARQQALVELLVRCTPEEADYLRRLLTGEVRQGALAGLVTDAVARAAGVRPESVRRAAMLTGDLSRTAALALDGGEDALAGVRLQVLHPVLPMLAATAPSVEAALGDIGEASVEWKLDGARVQAHRAGDQVRLFTRNLNDVTARLPGVVEVVASLPAERVILDGEVVGLGEDERPDRFQDTMSRFGRHDGAGAALTVAFFDVLHLDGEDLLDRPLSERLDALARVAGPWRVRNVVTADPVAAAEFLAGALAAGHEGVMVKALGSAYEAGRRGSAWRKVKPVRTFDLVVLGAEWGHGRRRGWLSNLHLGARDPGGGFVMVGKTFKGLTDELLRWQTARLQELAVHESGYVVEVRPELVVEVAIDGVQASTRYAGGVALRFARVRRYREDKAAADADTIDSVRSLLSPPAPASPSPASPAPGS